MKRLLTAALIFLLAGCLPKDPLDGLPGAPGTRNSPTPSPTASPTPSPTASPPATPTPPATPAPTPVAMKPSAPTITGQPRAFINFKTATFEFSSGSNSTSVTFKCKIDSGDFGDCRSPATFSNLPDGLRRFTVVAVNSAGMSSDEVSATWTIDTTAPAVTMKAQPANPTTARFPSFEFSSVDGKSGVAGFQCKLDSEPYANCVSPKQYSNLAIGTHTFSITVSDNAGNVSPAVSITWAIVKPTVQITLTPSASSISNQARFDFTGTSPAAPLSFECSLDGAPKSSCQSPIVYPNLSLGGHSFAVNSLDANNKVSDTATFQWTVSPSPVLGPNFVISNAIPGQKRQAIPVFDPQNRFYLVVHGNGNIGGAVLNTSGQQVGAGFQIAQTSAWVQSPNLFYSSEAGLFLVTWYDTRTPNMIEIRGRLMRLTSSGAPVFLSDDLVLGTPPKGSRMTSPTGIAHSTKNHEFLVVWQGYPAEGGVAVMSRRLNTTGQLVGEVQTLVQGPDWVDEPSVAYDPVHDEYMVHYAFAGAVIQSRMLRLNGQGALISGPMTLGSGPGVWLTLIHFNEKTGNYFLTWSTPAFWGQYINHDGSAASGAINIAPGYGGYDGFYWSFNSATSTYMFIFHDRDSANNMSMEMTLDGRQSPVFPSITYPGQGNYEPKLGALNDRGEWLAVSSNNFTSLVGVRMKSYWVP